MRFSQAKHRNAVFNPKQSCRYQGYRYNASKQICVQYADVEKILVAQGHFLQKLSDGCAPRLGGFDDDRMLWVESGLSRMAAFAP